MKCIDNVVHFLRVNCLLEVMQEIITFCLLSSLNEIQSIGLDYYKMLT